MIDKLIDLAVLAAGPLLALGIWRCCVVSKRCSEQEPVYDEDKRHSGLLTEED